MFNVFTYSLVKHINSKITVQVILFKSEVKNIVHTN